MGKYQDDLTRRKFLELSAAGAAGAAAYSFVGPSAFAATPKRGGTVKVGISWMWHSPDPQRFTGGTARPLMALAYEGLTMPLSVAERQAYITADGWTDKLKNFNPGNQFHHMATMGLKEAWLDT
ncbi:MAG: twin-arginine translocation signal domain-containing protein [Deltaproteobacteria bacterium]|jgi:hypothetical protein|nr:twin-arginine translocation signal domain-containing protein [Deltaproteobacteria bacterium]MBT6499697.1 twin-arginine translocation signal domain-containing protein [Deltaproteobacteria bacterium]MBT7155298.1 twin-arginine translocation signal domain-containing protein [Deltaproteobacteria bacterium]